MVLFTFILLLAAVLVLLIFTESARVMLKADSENSAVVMTMLWLQPLFKAVVTMEESIPVLTVYVFNRKILSKEIKPQKKSRLSGYKLLKIAEPRDIHVSTNYGFSDPFTTGVACGAINIASQFINIDEMNQYPDFTALQDYIYINATAKVNIGSALVNLLKAK